MTTFALSLEDDNRLQDIRPYFNRIAQKSTQPNACHIMVKPSSSVCNLDCDYCFYLEKKALYPSKDRQWQMTEETLASFVQQYIEAQDFDEVTFAWQGGEPTLMGLAFFEKAVALQQKYGAGKKVINTFQTNGVLLDEKWAAFFKKNDFLVGISIDGPAHMHDRYRKTRSGKDTFSKVMQGIQHLNDAGVAFNTLTVVNDYNVQFPLELYRFLTEIGSTYLQFIPLVERKANQPTEDGLTLVCPDSKVSAAVTEWSVPASAYGQFLCDIFDHWIKNDVSRIYVNAFDTALNSWLGMPAGTCVFSKQCGKALAMEANGDVYACDHYVYSDKKWGNIHHQTVREISQGPKARRFGARKSESLSRQCRECPYLSACHGGCPKHRFEYSDAGKPEQNYFCRAYRQFFSHADEYLKKMARLIENGRPASDVMLLVAMDSNDLLVTPPARQHRNSPCQCGSGSRYKHCCGAL